MYFKCSNCGIEGHNLKLQNNSNPPDEKNILCFRCWENQPIIITVNGKSIKTIKNELSYFDIIQMAYPGITPNQASYPFFSVTYREAYGGKEGILSYTESIKIVDGTKISAYMTNNA